MGMVEDLLKVLEENSPVHSYDVCYIHPDTEHEHNWPTIAAECRKYKIEIKYHQGVPIGNCYFVSSRDMQSSLNRTVGNPFLQPQHSSSDYFKQKRDRLW